MQFLTILKPKSAEYRIRGQFGGGRRPYFNPWYDLAGDPTTEGISLRNTTEQGCLPRELWPDVEIGIRAGFAGALHRGVRFCSVGFTMTFAKCHDVDTTPHAVQLTMRYCVSDNLIDQAAPVPPLRAEWLTSDVVAIARGIHANTAFDGLPVLCDALQDAGCDDQLVIDHLQTCPDHSPSCWVVEIILDQAAARV
jgi:hypothetical protein